MGDRPGEPAPNPPGEPPRAPPGRKPAYIESRRRDEFLGHLERGKGVNQVLRAMAIPYRAYLNTIGSDGDFRAEVECARRAADDELDEVGRLMAMNDSEVLFKLWDRRDKGRSLALARRDRARERAEDLERRRAERAEDLEQRRVALALQLRLAEMAIEARARARDRGGDEAEGGDYDVSRLSEEELALLRALLAKALGEEGRRQ